MPRDGSLRSAALKRSADALGSAGSILSIGSSGSILSIGSTGSILSIGSAGSILSVGSVGSIASVFSVCSAASFGSIFSGLSSLSVRGWQSAGASTPARQVRSGDKPDDSPPRHLHVAR
jgi:hypothetical protein